MKNRSPISIFLGCLAGWGIGKMIGQMTKKTNPSNQKFIPLNPGDWNGWVWPVPYYNGREPVISQEFRAGERLLPDGTLNKGAHMGVDIMYRRLLTDPTTPANEVAIPKSGSNPGYIAPSGSPIVAAGPGTIWRAGNSARGKWIQIDHGIVGSSGGINTYYQHLETFQKEWKKGDVVEAGDILGLMGGDPSTSRNLRHLHFELWKPVKGESGDTWPKDPAPVMKYWRKLQTV